MKPSPKPAKPLDWLGNPYDPDTGSYAVPDKSLTEARKEESKRKMVEGSRNYWAAQKAKKKGTADTQSTVPPSEADPG